MAVLAQLLDDVVVHKFELPSGVTTIGRHPDRDVQIDDASISSHHANLIVAANPDFPEHIDYYLEDNHSTNGTFINDAPVTGKIRLQHNDIIRLGWNSFKFIEPKAVNLEQTAHILR